LILAIVDIDIYHACVTVKRKNAPMSDFLVAEEFRKRIIYLRDQMGGKDGGSRRLAAHLGVSFQTVDRWIAKKVNIENISLGTALKVFGAEPPEKLFRVSRPALAMVHEEAPKVTPSPPALRRRFLRAVAAMVAHNRFDTLGALAQLMEALAEPVRAEDKQREA